MSNPWMKFYPSDWRADPALRMCSIGARGLWMEMLCVMHENAGELSINGKPLSDRQLSSLASCPDVYELLAELEEAGVFSRKEDGTIYSRRMIRDMEKAEQDKANGKKGGNRSLKGGVNPQDNPSDKAQKPEARSQKPEQLGSQKKVYDRLIDAASSKGTCHEKLAMGINPITDLIGKGYDLEKDILPVIAEKANPSIRSWSYFVTVIIQRQKERLSLPEKRTAPKVDWLERVTAFRDEGIWPMAWGPRPGDPGCMAPSELIQN